MRRFLLVAIITVLAGAPGCEREDPPSTILAVKEDHARAVSPEPTRPWIFWILVDTLRPDHLEGYGHERDTMPSLAPLVEAGTLFERAYTTRPETGPAIASLMTGLHPSHHGVVLMYYRLHEQNRTAAEIFSEAGYPTAAFVSSFIMIEDFSALSQGFDVYDDFVTERERTRENYERRAEHTLARARTWIEQQDDEPFFCFIHLIDPHGPYDPPAGFLPEAVPGTEVRPIPPQAIPQYARIDGATGLDDYRRHYDGEIRYTDHHLGLFFDFLREREILDDALVVFTSDHGESMGERGSYFVHGNNLFEENVRIPLIVKLPSGGPAAGRRLDLPVSIVDVLPTTLDFAGLALPEPLDGVSLRPWLEGGGAEHPPVVLERRGGAVPEWGLVRGDRKTILYDAPGAQRFEQYDLGADPREGLDLTARGGGQEQDREQLLRWAASATAHRLGFEPEHNHMKEALRGDFIRERMTESEQADTERLRALGYLD